MIYFCIPAYNEERTVGVVLWKLRQVMAELQRDYQIIVVDDASTDSTPAVLSPYIRVMPLTVIRNSERRGYADSVELALREATRRSPYPKRDAVIVLQADFTEDPDVITTLVKRFEAGADVVATDARTENDAPRNVRWGRRYLRWVTRNREWSTVGDPVSGLRAYRVVVLKKAIEARGTARLLSWPGAGANVELLWQVLPHSRRNEVVEDTIKHHRLQRPNRFTFMTAWREVRGAASGKLNKAATALPTDSVVATPLPVALEQPIRREQRPERGGRPRRPVREGREGREGRDTRDGRQKPAASDSQRGPKRGPRPDRPKAEKVEAKPMQPDLPATPPLVEGEKPRKKRRRARRRKDKRPKENPSQLAFEQTEPAPAASESIEATVVEGQPAPAKKKSRRGRRGGRGRRRGPRPANNAENGEAPPPVVAEGTE